MAKIPLRDYLTGIEELVDGGQIDEALAHCRHILESFPKNVDTYRTMGKAYLEAHRYQEAADIFQRVLASCPDDFVSHIGMSIVREEANDQDAAIWHMERAFEAQPSNRAVQDELRRLYAKREGYAPPKVRLTRGALARMYAHGDLYNQAIGELRSALAEDPQRPDLQVLLAEMFYKTNRTADAIEVCSKLIEKYPYGLFANRLMADILKENQRQVEARPYAERVEELDPYAAQVTTQEEIASVPAESVTIEQLILEGAEAKPQVTPKAWTATLEPALDVEKGDLPSWLSVDEDSLPEAAKEEPQPEPETLLQNLENLEPAPPQDQAPTATPPLSRTPTAALTDDQIPDWLRELGPATGTLSSPEEQSTAIEKPDIPKWTDEFKTAGFESLEWPSEENQPSEDSQPEERQGPAEGGPPNVKEQAQPIEEDEGLGWLEKLAAQQGAAEEELLTTPQERQESQPDWAPETKEDGQRDVLAWLDELESKPQDESAPTPAEFSGPAPIPDSQHEPVAAEEPGQEPAVEPQPLHDLPLEDETTPTWLRELSAEVEQSSQEAKALEPQAMEEAPDWLDELKPEAAPEQEEQEPEQPEETWQASDDLSKLDWLDELGPPAHEPAKTPESAWVPEVETAPDLPNADEPTQPVAPSPRRSASVQAAEEAEDRLEQARQALNFGKLADAADHYGHLLRRRLLLDEVVADLSAAVRRNPADATLWQTLGDAYMRTNQLREALDSYKKAEDLL